MTRSRLVHDYLQAHGLDLAEARNEYDGSCIDFAGAFLDWLGYGRMAYFETIGHAKWRYHAAVEVNGRIHDLWHGPVLPVAEFLRDVMRGGTVCYPLEES